MARPHQALLNRASEFVTRAAQIQSARELGDALAETVAPHGFPAVASGRLDPSGEIAALHFAVWDPRWREIYEARGFLRLDPVPLWAANCGTPADVGLLRARTPRTHPAQEVLRAAEAFGLNGGFIAPQRAANNHPGAVAFVGPRDPDHPVVRFVLCGLASVVFHRAEALFNRVAPSELPPLHPPLTARERECLRCFIEGRTIAAAAKAMEVSQATIRFHTRNLCAKMGAANRSQLTAIAIARGLVEGESGDLFPG